MTYFNHFVSNTLAGSGNQSIFTTADESKTQKGRLFYKIFSGGKYKYSLLFSNIIDSTYSNGAISNKNLICDEWYIEDAKIAVCDNCVPEKMTTVTNFIQLTFNNNTYKKVQPGEFFSTNAVELNANKDQYLCLEIAFKGRVLPYHEESIIPTFLYSDGEWLPSKFMPFPSMIGCDREVENRVAFIGDSITQGIGTPVNSYLHWNAILSEMIGEQNAYWNLGIGFGRADDAASNGAWLYKAKQNDIVFVCFGVNDIMQGYSEQQIKENLKIIVDRLKQCNIKVILQTIPPFDYDDEKAKIWYRLNNYIINDLSKCCDLVFDNVSVLSNKSKGDHFAKYGGHPNSDGCAAWAKSLYEAVKEII